MLFLSGLLGLLVEVEGTVGFTSNDVSAPDEVWALLTTSLSRGVEFAGPNGQFVVPFWALVLISTVVIFLVVLLAHWALKNFIVQVIVLMGLAWCAREFLDFGVFEFAALVFCAVAIKSAGTSEWRALVQANLAKAKEDFLTDHIFSLLSSLDVHLHDDPARVNLNSMQAKKIGLDSSIAAFDLAAAQERWDAAHPATEQNNPPEGNN